MAQAVIDHAIRRRTKDNVTAMVVLLDTLHWRVTASSGDVESGFRKFELVQKVVEFREVELCGHTGSDES